MRLMQAIDGSQSFLKRFLRSSPWTPVGIILAVGNSILTVSSQPPAIIVGFNFVVVFYGVIFGTSEIRKQAYRGVIDSLRKALDNLRSIFNQDSETSPIRLMMYVASLPDASQQTQKDVSDALLERTSVIHQILVQELQDCVTTLTRIDPSTSASKEPIKWVAEDSWRTLNWYRVNVIQILLQFTESKSIGSKSLQENLSKFQLVYLDALKDLRAARERANSELNFSLDINIDKLLVAKI
jgi:hypothetical protein